MSHSLRGIPAAFYSYLRCVAATVWDGDHLPRAAEVTGHLALEMRIVQMEVCSQEEVLTEFQRFSMKRRVSNILVIFISITYRHNIFRYIGLSKKY